MLGVCGARRRGGPGATGTERINTSNTDRAPTLPATPTLPGWRLLIPCPCCGGWTAKDGR
jgi:hypothetical protein